MTYSTKVIKALSRQSRNAVGLLLVVNEYPLTILFQMSAHTNSEHLFNSVRAQVKERDANVRTPGGVLRVHPEKNGDAH